jgi:hypothetical protein
MYRSPHILKKSFLLKQVSEMEIKLLLRNDLEPQIHGGRHDGFEYDTKGETNNVLGYKIKIKLQGGISNGDVKGIYLNNIISNFQ